MVYFDWCIGNFSNLLMFWKMYIYLAKIGIGDVNRAARVTSKMPLTIMYA